MDEDYFQSDNKRRTITITKPNPLDLNTCDSFDSSEDPNLSLCENDVTLTSDRQIPEDEALSETNEESLCDQLRGMTPTKITQLLNKLELDDERLASSETPDGNHQVDDYQESPQRKKVKSIKVKGEPKKTKGKKANDLENDEKESTKMVSSKEETSKTVKNKRGQKAAIDVDSLNTTDPIKIEVNSKSPNQELPEVLGDKKPNKSKGKKANELKSDVTEEPIPTKTVSAKDMTTKIVKNKRGQKGATDADNFSKDSNKADVNSKTIPVPPEVPNDKKIVRSKKTGNGKGKEDSEEKVNALEEKPKAKESKSKTTKITNSADSKEKNPSNKKKQEVKESTVHEKSSKSTKKVASELGDLKDSKITEGSLKTLVTTNEGKNISSRTRANKSPAKENEKGDVSVDVEDKPSVRPRRNKNQTDQEVPKSKETVMEKEPVEKAKKKVNSGKQKAPENSENKENEAKNIKVKSKTEPTKKETPVDTKENILEAKEKVAAKRVARKK